MQIKQFSDLAGVSVRTLHYYDEIGLLKPAEIDPASGYRFYDRQSLARMQEILFFRELDFPLKEICAILSSPDHDRETVLLQQRRLLMLKKERLERLIAAIDDATKGETAMCEFDNYAYEQYKSEVKQRWSATTAYAEYESRQQTMEDRSRGIAGLDAVLAQFAACMQQGNSPDSEAAQSLVEALQNHISAHFYTCTDEILAGLGQMYTADERFKENIDKHARGTADYISQAIRIYCQ